VSHNIYFGLLVVITIMVISGRGLKVGGGLYRKEREIAQNQTQRWKE
jgi:hypothetical protein